MLTALFRASRRGVVTSRIGRGALCERVVVGAVRQHRVALSVPGLPSATPGRPGDEEAS